MNHSGFVPEFGYDSHPQNSRIIFVNRTWKIYFLISFHCWDILHLPWSDSLVWNGSFQTGMDHSRLERIIPVWNKLFQSRKIYTGVVWKTNTGVLQMRHLNLDGKQWNYMFNVLKVSLQTCKMFTCSPAKKNEAYYYSRMEQILPGTIMIGYDSSLIFVV